MTPPPLPVRRPSGRLGPSQSPPWGSSSAVATREPSFPTNQSPRRPPRSPASPTSPNSTRVSPRPSGTPSRSPTAIHRAARPSAPWAASTRRTATSTRPGSATSERSSSTRRRPTGRTTWVFSPRAAALTTKRRACSSGPWSSVRRTGRRASGLVTRCWPPATRTERRTRSARRGPRHPARPGASSGWARRPGAEASRRSRPSICARPWHWTRPIGRPVTCWR